MDNKDIQIIQMLEVDGRASYSTIAKQVGLTSAAVGQRVQKMVDEGLILGFTIKKNTAKLGNTIQTIMSIKLNFSKIDAFYKILAQYPEIEQCYRVTGEECIIMKVNLRDNAHLLDFINQISTYGFSTSSIVLEQII